MSEPSERVPISDLKDTFLECPVCVEHFNQTDRRPRLLHSCLHAFCTQCLQQLLEKEGKDQITCPLCRQVQKVTGKVESLPKDPVRDQLVEYLQITHKRNILCKDCPDEHSAQSRCMECGENLCQECENAHKRNRSTRSHCIVSFEELETESCGPMKIRHFCPSHPDRLIECFCSKCETLCCLLCAVIDHKGHDLKKLDDAANIKIKELEKMLTNVDKVSSKLTTAKSDCEAYIDSIHEDKEKAVSEINKSYEALANLLRKRQFFLLREVEERSQKLVSIAKKSARQYDDALAEIRSTQTYFSNAKSTDEVSLLQTYPSLKKTLSQITRNHNDDMKKFTQKIAFEAVEEENLYEQISGYGAVKDFKREGHRYYTKSKEEKKKYDRDFLLSLRHSRLSMKKPQSLPNIPEIIPDSVLAAKVADDMKKPALSNKRQTQGNLQQPQAEQGMAYQFVSSILQPQGMEPQHSYPTAQSCQMYPYMGQTTGLGYPSCVTVRNPNPNPKPGEDITSPSLRMTGPRHTTPQYNPYKFPTQK